MMQRPNGAFQNGCDDPLGHLINPAGGRSVPRQEVEGRRAATLGLVGPEVVGRV